MSISLPNLYNNIQINGCALIPHMMTFLNAFVLYFKERVSKKEYTFNPLSTNFKEDRGLKSFPARVKGKTQKQRWVCDNKDAYMGDLDQTNQILEDFMDRSDFLDYMSPCELNWSVIHSNANLSEPQEAHTHLVPEYNYD